MQVEDARVEAVERVLGGDRVGGHAALAGSGRDLERDAARERPLVQTLHPDDHGTRVAQARVEVQLVQHTPDVLAFLGLRVRERQRADVWLGQAAVLDATRDRAGRRAAPNRAPNGAHAISRRQETPTMRRSRPAPARRGGMLARARALAVRRHDRASFQQWQLRKRSPRCWSSAGRRCA